MTTRIAPGVGANLLGQHSAERNQDATAYVGNLDPQVLFSLSPFLFIYLPSLEFQFCFFFFSFFFGGLVLVRVLIFVVELGFFCV